MWRPCFNRRPRNRCCCTAAQRTIPDTFGVALCGRLLLPCFPLTPPHSPNARLIPCPCCCRCPHAHERRYFNSGWLWEYYRPALPLSALRHAFYHHSSNRYVQSDMNTSNGAAPAASSWSTWLNLAELEEVLAACLGPALYQQPPQHRFATPSNITYNPRQAALHPCGACFAGGEGAEMRISMPQAYPNLRTQGRTHHLVVNMTCGAFLPESS